MGSWMRLPPSLRQAGVGAAMSAEALFAISQGDVTVERL